MSDAKMERKGSILMQRYELGRMLGQGTFAKVYYGRSLKTGQNVAIKIIDKEKMMRVGLIEQIKREISVMRIVRHPNVVQLYEVMASKTKMYFAMEYVKGGELFNKVARGKLREDVTRKYFQQLVAAVDFCHSRGVYHRDLKPENMLLDENGDLKVTDFGLSALQESRRQDGLLHTTCGTPAYAAPEVINQKGYDGAKADIWSCGVILFVLMAGYLPFHDQNLMAMYKKINRGEFKCPQWFPPEVRKLLSRILDPHPGRRISVAKIMENSWFKKGNQQIESRHQLSSSENAAGNRLSCSDVHAAFSSDPENCPESPGVLSRQNELPVNNSPAMSPNCLNAFDIISLSPGFDLSGLFENELEQRPESRFTSKLPASAIVSKMEQIAETEKFRVKKTKGTLQLQGVQRGRKGQLGIDAEIFQIAESFFMVEVKKTAGDTFEYRNFCNKEFFPKLKDIVWTWQGNEQQPPQQDQLAAPSPAG